MRAAVAFERSCCLYRLATEVLFVEAVFNTFTGCSMKRRQGQLDESSETLWLQRPRGGT